MRSIVSAISPQLPTNSRPGIDVTLSEPLTIDNFESAQFFINGVQMSVDNYTDNYTVYAIIDEKYIENTFSKLDFPTSYFNMASPQDDDFIIVSYDVLIP